MNSPLWEITTTISTPHNVSAEFFEGESNDKILDHATCPICMEIPTSKIYQCTNGHILCEYCLLKVKLCPQCQQSFEVDGIPIRIRARVLENILDSIERPCPYKKEGCTGKFSRKLLNEHKETCIFNGKCLKFCNSLGYKCDTWFHTNASKRNSGLAHLVEKHDAVNIYVRDDVSVSIKINYLDNILEKMETDGVWPLCLLSGITSVISSNCLAVVTMYNSCDKSLSWVCVELENKEKKKFEVEFSIRGKCEYPTIYWKVDPVPVVNFRTAKISAHNLLRIPASFLAEKYTNPEDNQALVINIKRRVVGINSQVDNTERNSNFRESITKVLGDIVPIPTGNKTRELGFLAHNNILDSFRQPFQKLFNYCNQIGAIAYRTQETSSTGNLE